MTSDPTTSRITIFDPDRGILVARVKIPEDLVEDYDRRMIFCEGAASGVAALANELWPGKKTTQEEEE